MGGTTTTFPAEEINRIGLTEVYRPPIPQADVVFCHGLNGSPSHTWRTNKGVFWPSDLLPRVVPNARILVYGYNADVVAFADGASKDGLHNHGESLVASLFANRNKSQANERPIVFVGHSLGGLVIKSALIYSFSLTHPNTMHLKSIFLSTYGILFLGTPHTGSDIAKMGSIMQSLLNILVPKKLLDSSSQLVQTLITDNKILRDVNHHFMTIMGNFHVYFFYESKPMDLKGTRKIVVDEASAAPMIVGVERMGIDADHGAMCRFEKENSPGYEAVSEAIFRYTTEAAPGIIERWATEKRDREIHRRDMLNRLNMSLNDGRGDSLTTLPYDSLGNSVSSLPASQPGGSGINSAILAHSTTKNDFPIVAPLGFHPNSIFVGMQDELEKLHVLRSKKEGLATVLVHGGPGSGKSHLVREYLYRHEKSYSGGRYWIDAKSKESLFNCYRDIAEAVLTEGEREDMNWGRRSQLTGLAGADGLDWPSKSRVVAKIRKWFESKENWLLVFDGVSFDGDDDINEFRRFLPYSRNSCIIYTSVDPTLTKKQRLFEPSSLRVKPLSVEDALKLLLKDLNMKNPSKDELAKATELVKYYECLPLAIHALGHRLSATRKPILLYHTESHLTDKRLAEPFHGIMRDLIENDHLEALNLINILSFLGHHVPVGMIHLGRKALTEAGIEIRSSDDDGQKKHIDTTFATLIKYGLIERTFDPYPLHGGTMGFTPGGLAPTKNIDVVKLHSVVQGFCRDELKRRGRDEYNRHLTIVTDMLVESFRNASHRIAMGQGLVKDFREYEAHTGCLTSNFPRRDSSLRPSRKKLGELVAKIESELVEGSPSSSSQESFRKKSKSIFDWSSSMSSVPDTPTSGSSKSGWTDEKAESPVDIVPHVAYPIPPKVMNSSATDNGTSGSTNSEWADEKAKSSGNIISLQDEASTAPLMSPNLSQDTAVPTPVGSSPSLPPQKKMGFFAALGRPLRRVRGQKDLGNYRPVNPANPQVAISSVQGKGSASRPKDISGRPAKSYAEAALATMHRSSPPPPRGGAIKGVGRAKSQKENHPTWASVAAGSSKPKAPSLGPRGSSSALESNAGSDNGEALQYSTGLSGGLQPSNYSDQNTHSLRRSPNFERISPPSSQFHSRSGSRSSEGSSFPPLQDANMSARHPNPLPLPYEADIQITKTPQRPPIPKVPPRGTALLPTSPCQDFPIPGFPTGYSSQPMSRDPSLQSNHSLHTEPSRVPPKYSPAPIYAALTPPKRASPSTQSGRSSSPRLDTRSVQQLTFGMEPAGSDSSNNTPVSLEAPTMSRGSSGPGMIVRTRDGMTQSLVEFDRNPSTQHLRFGELDPISVEEARQRAVQQEQERRRRGYEAQLPYPRQNLMPTASDLGEAQEVIDGTGANNWFGTHEDTQRSRSESSPARPDLYGLGLYGRR